jgi:hypothetical protein
MTSNVPWLGRVTRQSGQSKAVNRLRRMSGLRSKVIRPLVRGTQNKPFSVVFTVMPHEPRAAPNGGCVRAARDGRRSRGVS